jgi:hypothetical protein
VIPHEGKGFARCLDRKHRLSLLARAGRQALVPLLPSIAEIDAREVGQLDLGEALELTALVALRDGERGKRSAVRWLQRWLERTEAPLIEDISLIAVRSPHSEANGTRRRFNCCAISSDAQETFARFRRARARSGRGTSRLYSALRPIDL